MTDYTTFLTSFTLVANFSMAKLYNDDMHLLNYWLLQASILLFGKAFEKLVARGF